MTNPSFFTASIGGLEIAWSIAVVDLESGQTLLEHEAQRVLPTASMGKVLLLVEVFRQAEAGRLDLTAPLPIDASHEVADSGLLHLFRDRTITVQDACLLVGAVSDNLATNALADLCGLETVQATGLDLGLTRTAFLDLIRDERSPQHSWAPSCGTAEELAQLFGMLHSGTAVSPAVSTRVLDVLSAGVDTSMVAGGLHLDPLAHREPDSGVALRHKTGHDAGVRVDAGIVTGPAAGVAYAVGAHWDASADVLSAGAADPLTSADATPLRIAVEDRMRAIGRDVLRCVCGGSPVWGG